MDLTLLRRKVNESLVRTLVAILLITGLPGISLGQKKEETPEKGLLKVPVWVEGEDGLWSEGRRQDFKLHLDDKESPLKSFQGPKNSTMILIVFDTVGELSRVDQVRNYLDEKLRDLPSNYWVGLLRSQDGLRVLQEPTDDREKLIDQIKAIQISGKAGLLDTLEPISRMATGILNKTGVRVYILYITDSGIGNYRADYLNPVINASDSGDLSRRFSDRAVQEQVSRTAESLSKNSVPIFILHLEYRPDSLNLAYQSGLERISSASGGEALLCRTVDEIVPNLESILNRIRSGYFLGVDYPEKGRSLLKIRAEARDADGNQFSRVTHPVQVERKRDK